MFNFFFFNLKFFFYFKIFLQKIINILQTFAYYISNKYFVHEKKLFMLLFSLLCRYINKFFENLVISFFCKHSFFFLFPSVVYTRDRISFCAFFHHISFIPFISVPRGLCLCLIIYDTNVLYAKHTARWRKAELPTSTQNC